MQKRKITAREVLQDIRAGKSDKTLMGKFDLSAQGLQSLFDKLVRAGVITQSELDQRVPLSERTVDLGLFVCPACGNIQGQEFVKCPRCSFTVPGKSAAPAPVPKAADKSGAVRVSATAREKAPTGSPSGAREDSPRQEVPMDPSVALIRMVNYCRALSIAAVVAYSTAVIGILVVSLRSQESTVLMSLVGIFALGVPAVAISVIVFVSLRVLTESLKVFFTVAGSGLRGPASGD